MRRRVGVIGMHPFYGPSSRRLARPGDRIGGLLSMAAYLAFWAVALVLARRELDARWPRCPRTAPADDPAMGILRERFARGELDESQFLAMVEVLRGAPGGEP